MSMCINDKKSAPYQAEFTLGESRSCNGQYAPVVWQQNGDFGVNHLKKPLIEVLTVLVSLRPTDSKSD